MDQYLYPWYDGDGGTHISTVCARNYDECLEKIAKHLIDEYDDLDDLLDYDDLIDQLADLHGVYIGDIYDITEFTNDSSSTRFR